MTTTINAHWKRCPAIEIRNHGFHERWNLGKAYTWMDFHIVQLVDRRRRYGRKKRRSPEYYVLPPDEPIPTKPTKETRGPHMFYRGFETLPEAKRYVMTQIIIPPEIETMAQEYEYNA